MGFPTTILMGLWYGRTPTGLKSSPVPWNRGNPSPTAFSRYLHAMLTDLSLQQAEQDSATIWVVPV